MTARHFQIDDIEKAPERHKIVYRALGHTGYTLTGAIASAVKDEPYYRDLPLDKGRTAVAAACYDLRMSGWISSLKSGRGKRGEYEHRAHRNRQVPQSPMREVSKKSRRKPKKIAMDPMNAVLEAVAKIAEGQTELMNALAKLEDEHRTLSELRRMLK